MLPPLKKPDGRGKHGRQGRKKGAADRPNADVLKIAYGPDTPVKTLHKHMLRLDKMSDAFHDKFDAIAKKIVTSKTVSPDDIDEMKMQYRMFLEASSATVEVATRLSVYIHPKPAPLLPTMPNANVRMILLVSPDDMEL